MNPVMYKYGMCYKPLSDILVGEIKGQLSIASCSGLHIAYVSIGLGYKFIMYMYAVS